VITFVELWTKVVDACAWAHAERAYGQARFSFTSNDRSPEDMKINGATPSPGRARAASLAAPSDFDDLDSGN